MKTTICLTLFVLLFVNNVFADNTEYEMTDFPQEFDFEDKDLEQFKTAVKNPKTLTGFFKELLSFVELKRVLFCDKLPSETKEIMDWLNDIELNNEVNEIDKLIINFHENSKSCSKALSSAYNWIKNRMDFFYEEDKRTYFIMKSILTDLMIPRWYVNSNANIIVKDFEKIKENQNDVIKVKQVIEKLNEVVLFTTQADKIEEALDKVLLLFFTFDIQGLNEFTKLSNNERVNYYKNLLKFLETTENKIQFLPQEVQVIEDKFDKISQDKNADEKSWNGLGKSIKSLERTAKEYINRLETASKWMGERRPFVDKITRNTFTAVMKGLDKAMDQFECKRLDDDVFKLKNKLKNLDKNTLKNGDVITTSKVKSIKSIFNDIKFIVKNIKIKKSVDLFGQLFKDIVRERASQ